MGFDNVYPDFNKAELPAIMSRKHLVGAQVAMLVLTSLVFVARMAVRVARRKTLELQDFFSVLAYICYIAMVVMNFMELDPLYRTEGVLRGEINPYKWLCEYLSSLVYSRRASG